MAEHTIQTTIRVVLVDDHALVRQGFRRILEDDSDITVVGEAGNGLEGLALAKKLDPDVVVMDSSIRKIDEFLHISRRMRRIALQSAIGGMALSLLGMLVAALGYLPPVAGALTQEVIDVVAVLNALRVAIPPAALVDFESQ